MKKNPIPSLPEVMMQIEAEVVRQGATEGYTAEYDDAHVHGELAFAAASYAATGAGEYHSRVLDALWPFEESAFKPKSCREDLIRSTALAVAEIRRLDRLAAKEVA